MKIRLILLLAVALLLSACASANLDALGQPETVAATPAQTDPAPTEETPVPTQSQPTTVPTEPQPTTPPQSQDELTEDVELAMREVYARKYGKGVLPPFTGTADEVCIDEYFGCFDGNYVAFFADPWRLYSEALLSHTLMGLEFRYCDYQQLEVYREGQVLPLSEAVENGWFTQEALAQLHAVYQARYSAYYSSEEW